MAAVISCNFIFSHSVTSLRSHPKPGLVLFKKYINLINSTLMIRHRYTVGKENIPAKGEKYFIACNHQNAANDAINIAFAYPVDYLQHFVVRANVFSLHPAITAFLSWLGLMPAFRMGWEGSESLEENFRLFDRLAVRINQGRNVLVFPESGHTQGHYLDPFSTGLVRMAFHTAKYNDWKEDIKILPTAHHYSNYHDAQYDFLWMVGEPISLQPYYEEFQEHPYRVMREVTRRMRKTIQSMMLDEGEDHYAEKDFLRRSALNPSTLKGLTLPEQLAEDKDFVEQIRPLMDCEELVGLTDELMEREQELGIEDVMMERRPTWPATLAAGLLDLLLLPLWLVSLWPHIICYKLPLVLLKEDKMFTNSYRFILSVVILYPLFALTTLLVMGLGWGMWWQALVWIMLWIPIGKFAWWYSQHAHHTIRALRFLTHPTAVGEIRQVRDRIRAIIQASRSRMEALAG